MPTIEPTTTVRLPVCFLCHRADLITLPAYVAAALAAGAPVQEVLHRDATARAGAADLRHAPRVLGRRLRR